MQYSIQIDDFCMFYRCISEVDVSNLSTTYGGLVHCNCGLSESEFSRNLSTEVALIEPVCILEITMYKLLLIRLLNFY